MEFAKQQLLKFGWTEGKGLGKNENGISEALKPKLKFDNTGVGHSSSEQFTFNWWENVFNNAADNINVKNKNGDVNIELNTEESVNITTKKYSIKKSKNNNNLQYGCFLKTSKLTANGMVDHEEKETCVIKEDAVKTINLTDDELFAACGGRTAHKGARHGHKLSGKLARLEQQEKMFQNPENQERETHKKSKKHKKLTEDNIIIDEYGPKLNLTDTEAENDINRNATASKKKKRKRKHSKLEEENEIEEQAARKRYENFCDKKERKKLDIKRRAERKQVSKISKLLENCKLEQPKSDDDGFDEKIRKKKKKVKLMYDQDQLDHDQESQKKKKKKKRKRCKTEENDDAGFCELMSEINEKLETSKEIRKKLRAEKKKSDDEKICKISEVLNKVCKV